MRGDEVHKHKLQMLLAVLFALNHKLENKVSENYNGSDCDTHAGWTLDVTQHRMH